MNKIYLKEIMAFLKSDIISISGEADDLYIKYIKSTIDVDKYSLDWISLDVDNKQNIAESSNAQIIIVDKEVEYSKLISTDKKVLIYVKNPKLIIIKIINFYFSKNKVPSIDGGSIINPKAKIGENVSIGPNCVLGKCIIGNNVIIHGNCYIYDDVTIGDNVEIHAGAIIGSEAHNFIRKDSGSLIKFPHIGSVKIGRDVVIGANSVISRAVLEDTVISEGCKIAQLVIVGANCYIGKNCSIRANVMISGSITIGNNSTIAPSATIRDHCKIGNNCMIGMGAIVTKDVPSNQTWIGNPAKELIK